jgi:pimeloyl-ACP methyl ester carboxylesterase
MSLGVGKIFLSSTVSLILTLSLPKFVSACSYESTITNNHLNLNITSDTNNIDLVQLMHVDNLPNAPYIVTGLQGPGPNIWYQYTDGDQTYSGYSMIIQNRRQNADGAYWVSWIDSNSYLHIPPGIYGLDFDGSMTYSDITIMYSTWDRTGEAWTPCLRTGDISTPTPTPTASPTPSPTPTPITKTVFIPGFGASWNGNAFANCAFDPNPDHWSLASYAESVYSPLLTALKNSGWDVKPFYYDWRAEIPSNAGQLANSISNFATDNEKINIVGHSMGGLVASDYFINQGQESKINSLITAGSPLDGVVQTYPAWAGGDIWDDNFLTKVAKNLYLKHCGGLFSNNLTMIQTLLPSVRNILPKYDYLVDAKSKTVKPTNNLHGLNKSNWEINSANLLNTKFETLTGNGVSTLTQIPFKTATTRDIQNGYWLDGKPAGKIYSTEGDGTVLLSSSKLDETHNVSINQTHSGLVNSSEGIAEILRFLGSPINSLNTQTSPTSDPTSALIIIGYPSNFWVNDQSDTTKKDQDGMVTFINPKTGSYKINLLPKSTNTLFVVAQFLPNGEVKYKEYKIEGFGPKLKTLNFSLENPREDILD